MEFAKYSSTNRVEKLRNIYPYPYMAIAVQLGEYWHPW